MAIAQPFRRETTSAKDDGPHVPRLYAMLLLSVVALTLAPSTRAQVTDFANLDVPGAMLTRPIDVNNFGVIVGRFDDQNGTHGFVYQGGSFTAIDFPSAELTVAMGINDSGDIVGRFVKGGVDHGFLFFQGAFRQIDVPGSIATECHGINAGGAIVGRYLDVKNPANGQGSGVSLEHGFLLSDGRFTSVDFPNANTTDAWKITDAGKIVGDWSENGSLESGSLHGYAVFAGQFEPFDFPGVLGTAPREVSATGQMVGIYISRHIANHGFVVLGGTFYAFDFPGSSFTDANGLNNSGVIVGSYLDASGTEHGYTALTNWK